MIATWFDVAYENALGFGLGVVVGFLFSNRYRLSRRDES